MCSSLYFFHIFLPCTRNGGDQPRIPGRLLYFLNNILLALPLQKHHYKKYWSTAFIEFLYIKNNVTRLMSLHLYRQRWEECSNYWS